MRREMRRKAGRGKPAREEKGNKSVRERIIINTEEEKRYGTFYT